MLLFGKTQTKEETTWGQKTTTEFKGNRRQGSWADRGWNEVPYRLIEKGTIHPR